MSQRADTRFVWRSERLEALWDAWAFAAVEAELALKAWHKAAQSLKTVTYAAYLAALDREEEAAARLAARVSPEVGRRLETRWMVGRAAA